MRTVTIPWQNTAEAIDRFAEFFRSKHSERINFGELALSTRNIQMAAIAAVAEQRLAEGPSASKFGDRVVEAALEGANAASARGDLVAEIDCLRAGLLASESRPTARASLVERLNLRFVEELERGAIDISGIGALISCGGLRADVLREAFEKAAELNSHVVAGLAAEGIVRALNGKVDKSLMVALRLRTRELLVERNAEAAVHYLAPLNHMVKDVDGVTVLVRRVAHLLGERLKSLLKTQEDWSEIARATDVLAQLEAENLTLIRAQLLLAARRDDTDAARERLAAMEKAGSVEWPQLLRDARIALKQDEIRTALLLFNWLRERGYADLEAAKANLYVLRLRRRALRDSASGAPAGVCKAADELLEIEPDNASAMWAQARALLRMRQPEKSRAVLDRLLAISPTFPGAADAVERLKQRIGT